MKLISAIECAVVVMLTVAVCLRAFIEFDTTLLGIWLAFNMLVFIFFVALDKYGD